MIRRFLNCFFCWPKQISPEEVIEIKKKRLMLLPEYYKYQKKQQFN